MHSGSWLTGRKLLKILKRHKHLFNSNLNRSNLSGFFMNIISKNEKYKIRINKISSFTGPISIRVEWVSGIVLVTSKKGK